MLTPEQMKAAMDKWIEKITPNKDRPVLNPEQQKLLQDKLGYCGRMISGSKQTPKSKYGEHLAVFNGNPIPWDRYTIAQLLDLESLIVSKRPRT